MTNNNVINWCELLTEFGKFRMYDTNNEAVKLVSFSALSELSTPTLLRVHSSCSASEIFGSLDCDCADQLKESMRIIAENKNGIIIYLDQEGRGQGLANKIKAVHLMQQKALDTVEAFDYLNLKHDIRNYDLVVDLLEKLKIDSVRLITNNPRKIKYLEDNNIKIIERIRTSPIVREENREYLYSKNAKLDHNILLSN